MLEVAVRKIMAIKGWTWSATILRLWHLNHDWMVLRGLKWFKKTFPTPLNHQPVLLTQGRLGPWIHAVDTKFWPNHLLPQQKSTPIRSGYIFPVFNSSAESMSTAASDFCSWLKGVEPTGSSAAVVTPSQGWMWCSFKDAFQFTTVVKSSYLSCHSLSVSSN